MAVCTDEDIIYLVRGDVGSQIKATLTRDDDGSAIDLTGATVTLKVAKYNRINTIFSVVASGASATQLANGIVIFTFSLANLATEAGKYSGEIQVDFPDSTTETVYERVTIMLRDDFE